MRAGLERAAIVEWADSALRVFADYCRNIIENESWRSGSTLYRNDGGIDMF